MAIEFQCPSCQAIYRAKDEFFGRSTRCRQCGTTVRIEPMGSGTTPTSRETGGTSERETGASSGARPAPRMALTQSPDLVAPRIENTQRYAATTTRVGGRWGPFTRTGMALCAGAALLPVIAIGVGHIQGAQDIATTLAYVGLFLAVVGAGLCSAEKQWIPGGVAATLGIFAFGIGIAFIPSGQDSAPTQAPAPAQTGSNWVATPTAPNPPIAPAVPVQVLSSADQLTKPLPATRPFASEDAIDRLEPPVRFNDLAIRPPRKATVFLQDFSTTAVQQIRWQVASSAIVSIAYLVKDPTQTSQRRVLAVTGDQPAPRGVITVAGNGAAFESTGTIAGMTFQRIVFGASQNQFNTGYYVADLGARFLVIRLAAEGNDSELGIVFDQFARSLHKPAAGDVVRDAFDNDSVVARLQGKEADDVLKLLAHRGKSAEPILLRQLERAAPEMQIKLIDALASAGTDESIPSLVRLSASSNPDLRRAARRTGAAIRPQQFNDFALAIMDVQAGDEKSVERGLQYLARTDPTDRRDDIALLLEKVYRNSIFRKDILIDAMWRWQNDRLIYMLIDDISSGDCPDFNVEAAFTLLPRTRNPDAARAIARWLTRRPDRATDALMEFGAIVEPIAIDLLTDPTAVVREKAVQLLRSEGTEACLEPLAKLEKRSTGTTRDAIREAIEAIQQRLGIVPTTAPAASPTRSIPGDNRK